MDIVLIEGYKRDPQIYKIEVYRSEVSGSLICLNDPKLLAVVSNTSFDNDIIQFAINDIKGLADFIVSLYSQNNI